VGGYCDKKCCKKTVDLMGEIDFADFDKNFELKSRLQKKLTSRINKRPCCLKVFQCESELGVPSDERMQLYYNIGGEN
jgi:hypothetical protein